jgi:hypothetical protein
MTNPKLAVFIDCENASARLLLKFFSNKHHLMTAGTRRAFGSEQTLNAWKKFFAKHDFDQVKTPPSVRKKNATDFALVIDCVHKHQTHDFNRIWLVTSDSDFTLLAKHLRSPRTKVICVGEAKTPDVFRQACNKFHDYKMEPGSLATVSSSTSPAVATT